MPSRITHSPEVPLPRAKARKAVLLINLGSPDAPTPSAVRRFLKDFLSDPRVVDLPRILWWFILHGIILNTRPKKSAEKYAAIWTQDGSPLKIHTEKQTKLMRGFLGQAGHKIVVDYAMRYGLPSIPDTLSRLKAEGCTHVLLLPLYPQYSSSTTGTVFDAVDTWAKKTPNPPAIHHIKSFADNPGYIRALAARVHKHWMENGQPATSYRLLMSFHGMPRKSLDKGDPYYHECLETGRLLAEELNLQAKDFLICFQSRFGCGKWLQPYTAQTLTDLGRQGIQRVDVLCPGFTSDCLETLEEIAIEGKATFLQAGGKEFHYISCLNERDDWIHTLVNLSMTHLQNWTTQNIPKTDLK